MNDELLNQFLFGDLDDKNTYVVEHFSVSNIGYLPKLVDWSDINQNTSNFGFILHGFRVTQF